MQLLFRFFIGGLVVSFFAVLGDAIKPKSLAGLFSAAPSVAIATLGLTILANGKPYATLEARSMVIGAAGFFIYAIFCARLLARHKLHATPVTVAGLLVWLACTLGGWLLLLR